MDSGVKLGRRAVSCGLSSGATCERLGPKMPEDLNPEDWNNLMRRIKRGDCTPFLGAGACAGVLPLGADIARDWATKHNYPLDDSYDLARVSQFIAVTHDAVFPKENIVERLQQCAAPDFSTEGEPHDVLAELPLKTYLTTNYDDFMVRALRARHRDPNVESCRWNEYVRNGDSLFSDPVYKPTVANPLVFHLHGKWDDLGSIVLTEDDYLDFLVSLWSDHAQFGKGSMAHQLGLVPPVIRDALTTSSLLFIGYRLQDWDFRVLHRGLLARLPAGLQRLSVTVQLPPTDGPMSDLAKTYLSKYFETQMKVRVFWGTAAQFAAELRRRWRKFDEPDKPVH